MALALALAVKTELMLEQNQVGTRRGNRVKVQL